MTNELTFGTPEDAGVCSARLEVAFRLIEAAVAAGEVTGASLCVARRGVIVASRGFGRRGLAPGAPPVQRDTVFLVASITKPVTCAAAMRLVERGELLLDDPVSRFVPEFAAAGKEAVQVRHLLTHTSGLPDMLPDNRDLRAAHTPLSGFIHRICEEPLLFPPGAEIRYQSMGTAMLAEIVERATKTPLPRFLHETFFRPLGMTDTVLGIRPGMEAALAECRLEAEHEGTDWGWNSPYWRGFGAPWGGMFSTPRDVVAFGQMFLQGGRYRDTSVLGRATAAAMVADQTARLPDLPNAARRAQAWGFGWRVQPFGPGDAFGDLLGPRAFGHLGATGTVTFCDPDLELAVALFTNEPLDNSRRVLARVSNAVVASVEG
jgi:CubicO group peptidase (beta-lactamase class C family)